MPETNYSITNQEGGVKAGKLDLSALADAFESQGNVGEAKRYRDLARGQTELEKRSNEKMSAHLDKKQQEERKSQSVIVPLQPQERADAKRYNELRAEIEKMLPVRSKQQTPK